MQTLLIDNYDSYTFNLYQLIAKINGVAPLVIRNDEMSWEAVQKLSFDNIVISPGPGHPKNSRDFGICKAAIEQAKVPVLGVCLGHQGIAQAFGGRVVVAPEVMHGRLSAIYHKETALFSRIPQAFSAVRYHSLIVDNQYLPTCLEVTAWTKKGLIMALQHRERPLFGVQFHPESICTDYGRQLLSNFTAFTKTYFEGKKYFLIKNKKENKFRENIFSKTKKTPTSIDLFGRCRLEGKLSYFRPLEGFLRAHSHSYVTEKRHKVGRKEPILTRYEPRRTSLINNWTVFSRKIAIFPNPEQVFIDFFKNDKNAFWLDSSLLEKGQTRFSFMGGSKGENSLLVEYQVLNQQLTIRGGDGKKTHSQERIFDYLKRTLALRQCDSEELPFDFNGGFVGYLGYELKAECGGQAAHVSSMPDATFLFADQFFAFDHEEKTSYLVYVGKEKEQQKASDWFDVVEQRLHTVNTVAPLISPKTSKQHHFELHKNKKAYLANIQDCLAKIQAGESYEVCLTNELHTTATPDPLAFYQQLRQQNPAPYSAFLRFGELAVACSSPERFLKIDRNQWAESKPIKGTIRRGDTFLEDVLLKEQLYNSEKDRAENLMIVDLLRNDLGRFCKIGSITVPKLMEIESYATVHQLVSTVSGQLQVDKTAVDAVQKAFPGGSMTGAPKIRTMAIIDDLEERARGIYSGAIGFFALNGTADLNIVIRTAVFTSSGTSIGTGGAVTALSNPHLEFEELLLKAKALITVMGAPKGAKSVD